MLKVTDRMLYKIKKPRQYLFSVSLILLVSAGCYFLSPLVGYKVIAFVLLITVSLLAMFFDILPVLAAAVLSALIWDYFFIPPHFTFSINSQEDYLLFFMYFVIAMVNAVLTYKIRTIEKLARDQEEKEHTVKLYNTLLNSLSHELRTPIAAIIGATDNLQNNTNRLNPEQRNELLKEIAKASFRLNQQVENLLNMSRLESGFIKPRCDWCDVNELIYEVVKQVEDNDISQKIAININPDIPLFKLDKGMLQQVIYNLLNNAVMYCDERSVINISAACHTDMLEIIVEDNGPGFPQEEIAKAFDKFYRINNSRAGGTGLGLSIVKGFTEAMGGSVYLKNVSAGGARFTISIAGDTSYLKNLKNE